MSSNPSLVSSFRYVTAIPSGAAHEAVVQSLRQHDNAVTDLETAIPILTTRIDSLEKAAASSSSSSSSSSTTAGVASFNGETGAVSYFPDLGSVDDQTGVTSYTIQTQDSGAFLIFNDASSISVSLNPVLQAPFIVFAMNMGTGTVTFNATSPQTINSYFGIGAASFDLLPGYMCIITINGFTWDFGTLPIVPLSFNSVAHQWINSYNATTGLFTASQPSFADISGIAQPSQGGTGINSSADTGVAQLSSGTWSVSSALADGTTATTQAVGDSSASVATDEFVQSAVTGSRTYPYTIKTAAYPISSTDYQIECTANSFTVTLPTAIGIVGKVYSIKNSGTGTITVDTTSSQTIDGSLTQNLSQYDNLQVMSNGANWIII